MMKFFMAIAFFVLMRLNSYASLGEDVKVEYLMKTLRGFVNYSSLANTWLGGEQYYFFFEFYPRPGSRSTLPENV